MAVTVTTTILDRGKLQGARKKLVFAQLGLSGTYDATTEIAVTAAQFGLTDLDYLMFLDATIGGYAPWYDSTNKKIRMYRPEPVIGAYTFSGDVLATHQHAAITAGTPAGSVAAPTFTGSALGTHQHAAVTAGTPAGTVAAPTFTGAELATHQHAAITAGTPAGTVAAPTFTGAELATHQHAAITAGTPAGTVAAPTFTGAEMGTHQHAAITAGTPAGTVAAPTFTGAEMGTHQHAAITAGTPAGSVAAPTFTGTAYKPRLVVEEAVTVTSHTGTLANVPLYIVAVQVTAGGTTGAFNLIPAGETPLTKQAAINFTTGVLTFLDTDAVTAAKVTYLPVQPTGNLVSATLVVDEAVTAAAAKATLANRACAVQYVWDDTDGVLCTFEPVGEEPSATHKCVVDITSGTDTTLDSHGDDEGNSLKVTYLKYASFPSNCCVDDADLTLAAENYNFLTGGGYSGTVVPGLGTHIAGEEVGTGNEIATWEGPSGAAANTVGVWNPVTNAISTNNTNAFVTLAMPWFVLDWNQLTMPTPAGTNSAPAFTGSELATHQHAAITAGTPAGTNSAPGFTGSELATHQHAAVTAGTPAGTNSAPAFTGSELATHQHAAVTAGTPAGTNSAPAFTGSELATHIHAAITAGTPAGTNSAPAFTGSELATHQHAAITAGTPAGTNSAPAFTGSQLGTHQHAAVTAGTPAGTIVSPVAGAGDAPMGEVDDSVDIGTAISTDVLHVMVLGH